MTTPGARKVAKSTPPTMPPFPCPNASLNTNSIRSEETTGANSVCIPTFQNRRVSRRHSVHSPSQFIDPYCRGPSRGMGDSTGGFETV